MALSPLLASRRAASHASAPKPSAQKTSAEKAKLAAIQQDAQRRTAAAWTMAKTLLPQASPKAQMHLASALVAAPTSILAAAFRAVARMAFKTKQAEAFEGGVKQELNVFVENPGLLETLKNELERELKAKDPLKTAARKKADPGTLDGPAGPPALNAPVDGPGADVPPVDAAPPATPPMDDPSASEPLPPPALPAAGEPIPGNEGNDLGGGAADGGLMDKIQQTESQIEDIESDLSEAEDESLDLAALFNPEVQAQNADNLANEGEEFDEDDAVDGGDEFGPSSTEDMMDKDDFGGDHTSDHDYFKGASLNDPMASLFGKQAGAEVDVKEGDMLSHFKTDLAGDTRNNESDHESDLLTDVLLSLDQPTRTEKRDTAPKFETPVPPQGKSAVVQSRPASQIAKEKAAQKKNPIKSVGHPSSKQASSVDEATAAVHALFGDD